MQALHALADNEKSSKTSEQFNLKMSNIFDNIFKIYIRKLNKLLREENKHITIFKIKILPEIKTWIGEQNKKSFILIK